jgi:hypothetical protein
VPSDGLFVGALADPLSAYPALAALLLASVALASGLMRGDALALARPAPVAWLLTLVAITWGISAAADAVPWPAAVAGVARAPLYLFALAYGPFPGLVAAAIVAAWVPFPHTSAGGPLVLALELLVVGWLAVWPSPRRRRAVGPLYALLGYALAAATLGVSFLALRDGTITVATLRDEHHLTLAGLAVAALLLSIVSPGLYRRAFPGSGIVPPTDATAEPPRSIPSAPPARDATLAELEVPPAFSRQRRARPPLSPPPDLSD